MLGVTLGPFICCYSCSFKRAVAQSFLPCSACRHADRTISSSSFGASKDVWRMVSEDSGSSRHVNQSFLLIVRTPRFVTALILGRVPGDTSEFPAYSQILFSELQRS